MSKFKVGDRVRVVATPATPGSWSGEIFKLIKAREEAPAWLRGISESKGDVVGLLERELELIPDAN